MATINAPTLQNVQYSGAAPLAAAHGAVVLAAAAIADKVRLVLVSAGTKVDDVKAIYAALGAGTTISVGYEYADGSGADATAFINAQATAAAGSVRSAVKPVTLTKDAYITATVGGGVATGALDVVALYEPRGV
ncbi:hypothetical protein [Cupriavidus alkaliphilus]|uniref:Cell division GTPase FtsZ n=1 Tax=Cupriavidus alkaliphilus TaxID=942866 RepID=A0A7W4VFF3_9BURK|nr:hypothetical protein [Cupriavidus alkaliphilus]MBB3010631.1 cell division GTPase FtsZ [Cupriavidus alkaliphilus]